jgi:hypothetical protein
MRSMIGVWLLLALAPAFAREPGTLFQPHAIVDRDPVCASVVEHARVAFRTDEWHIISAKQTALENRYDLRAFSITRLSSAGYIQGNVNVRGQLCHIGR